MDLRTWRRACIELWTPDLCSRLVASSGVDGGAGTIGDVVVSGACSGQTGDGVLSATGVAGIVAPSTPVPFKAHRWTRSRRRRPPARRVGTARLTKRGRYPPNRGSLAERIRARRRWTACTDEIGAPLSTPDGTEWRSGVQCHERGLAWVRADHCRLDNPAGPARAALFAPWTPDLCSLRSRRPALTGETGADVGGTFGSRYLMLTLDGVLDASGAAFLCRRRARPEHVVRHVPE